MMKDRPARKTVSCAVMLVLLFASASQAQTTAADTTYPLRLDDLRSTFALRSARQAFYREQVDGKIRRIFTQPITTETENVWRSALWAAGLLHICDVYTSSGVAGALSSYGSLNDATQRQTLEAVYELFPQEFTAQVTAVAEATTSPKLFAMAVLYLIRANGAGVAWPALARLMESKFPDRREHPILVMLEYDATKGRASGSPAPTPDPALIEHSRTYATTATIPLGGGSVPHRPPLTSLFSSSFQPGYPVVYSLQRRDRSYPGMALVRRADGRFSRNADGSIFCVGHLARSDSNLPGYITNGNTPHGVFSITMVDVARTNKFIGKTPLLVTMMPFEADPATYFHNPTLAGTSWTLQLYQSVLPTAGGSQQSAEWDTYFPINEVFFAGKAGRSDILAHGTGVDPDYYCGQPWYPNTPTIGCMSAKEIWDEETGRALMSDQLALVNAYIAAAGNRDPAPPVPDALVPPQPKGFLALIELDGAERPVMLDDVLMDVFDSEARH